MVADYESKYKHLFIELEGEKQMVKVLTQAKRDSLDQIS
jgi:hypothetical protein